MAGRMHEDAHRQQHRSGYLLFFACVATLQVLISSGCSPVGVPSPDVVTYHEEVAWILQENCVACHRSGGIAPFALETYDQAVTFSAAALQSMLYRTMPPININNDGSCHTFSNAQWLSEDELRRFSDWIEQGWNEGDPAGAPPPYQATNILKSPTPILTPEYTPQEIATDGGHDDYRCFVVDPALPGDRFVTGFEVMPSNPAIVHHLVAFTVDPNQTAQDGSTNGELMEALDAVDPEVPGWSCYGLAGNEIVPNGLPASWAPGGGTTLYPAGLGVRIRQGDLLVLQLHYNTTYATGSDQTTLFLQLEESVAREGIVLLNDGMLATLSTETPAVLPPGEERVTFSWTTTYAEIEAFVQEFYGYSGSLPGLDVYGVYPHMHALGNSMRVERTHEDGSADCLADVARWDFNWQRLYFYTAPVRLGAGEAISVTCVYDTRARLEDTSAGFDTDDEMCMLGAFVTLAY